MRTLSLRMVVTALLLLCRPAGADHTITFPLVVDYDLLASSARSTLGFADGEAVLWGTAGGCHSLIVDDVAMGRADEKVRITLHGRARIGLSFVGFCLFPLRWEGYVDTLGRPEIGADWQLHLRDIESKLLDKTHRPTTVSSRVWELVRDEVETRVAAITIDLGPPVREGSALVRSSVAPERAEPVLAALQSLRPVKASVDDEGVKIEAAMEVPETQPAPSTPEPGLSSAELQAFQERLEHWD